MFLRIHSVDDFEKREPVEISIAGADSPDSILAHKNSRMSVVQEIAGEVRKVREDLSCNLGVSLGRDKKSRKQC